MIMKLCEILDFTTNPKKYPTATILNQYKNYNFGNDTGLETKDFIVQDKKTGKIYGRRTLVQRKINTK
jgi:hypothetical protein